MHGANSYKATGSFANQHWWLNQLNLKLLHQHSSLVSPLREEINYAEAFKTIDLNELKQDPNTLMTTSQDWWPADYGHYGPFFTRMSWHSAGTYRTLDGRGGTAVVALKGVDVTVLPGKVIDLLGSSCSGKSTLFKCQVAVKEPTA